MLCSRPFVYVTKQNSRAFFISYCTSVSFYTTPFQLCTPALRSEHSNVVFLACRTAPKWQIKSVNAAFKTLLQINAVIDTSRHQVTFPRWDRWWRYSLPKTATESWLYPVTAGRNFLLLKQQPGPGCVYQVVRQSPNVSCSTVTKDSWVAERSICKSELSIDSDGTYWLKLVQAETKACAREEQMSQQGQPRHYDCQVING